MALLTDSKLILRPLVGLMRDQPHDEVERHLVREIEKHRRLRDSAILIEAQIDAVPDSDAAQDVRHDYIAAMIAVHAQQTVVSTLIDILGYLPPIPRTKGH